MNDQKRHEGQADDGIRGTGMAYSVLDHLSTPMMMVDRSFVIRFANQASFAMLRKHEAVLAQRFPGFRVDQLVGTNFDTFHKDPSRQRSILSEPRNLPFRGEMSLGGLTFSITVNATRTDGGAISGYALEWHDVTEQRKRDAELMRVKQAVQNASVPLMLVDRDLVITYVNDATMKLMREKESTLRTVFRNFAADALVGTCIDSFHANPSHQRKLLADPKNLPYCTTIKVGSLRFRLNVTAIMDPAGQYIGNTLEWNDVTAQVAAEDEVQKLIESAAAGRLDERIDVSAWSGFVKTMGAGLNELLEAVSRPVKEVTTAAQALAQGDLTHAIEGDFRGEFGSLVEALNACTQNLRDMVASIRESASTVAQGAAELSEGNTNLSSRTQEQAAALEETASTVAEMTVTVKHNAETARNANDLATDARQVAEKGGEVVGKAVQAMAAIRDSSKKIEDIIAVIDEIAFQTNLLALNAAVEAARAGDQGRGFAVVAAEVRSLAQRSAGAAKEIKTLIKDSVEKVDLGTKLVDHSGTTLLDIVKGVKKVSDMVESIASASTEQAAGIEQVNKAIGQMEEAVQQNAALVEEAAAASASMDDQAKSLQELMGNFVVEDADAYEEPEPPPPPVRRARPAAAGARPNGHGHAPKANGHAPARPASIVKPAAPAPARAARPAPRAAHRNGKSNGHAHVEDEHWESF